MADQVKVGNSMFQSKERALQYHKFGNIVQLSTGLAEHLIKEGYCKDARILDFGCAVGFVGIPLLEHSKSVCFLDPSEGMCEVLRESLDKQPQKNYDICQGTMFDYKGEPFDLVIAQLVLHHIEDHMEALKEVAKYTKPGGKLVIVEFMPSETGRRAWTEQELKDICAESGFTDFKYRSWLMMHARLPGFSTEIDQPLCFAEATKI